MVSEKNSIKPPIGVLTGPTATGKSSLAVQLASQNSKIEILNADSLLVYKGMDIGTAKPLLEDLRKIPHHLIDIVHPNEFFTSGEFVRRTEALIQDIHQKGNRVLIVGGTGFYLKSLLFGLWKTPSSNPAIKASLEQKENFTLFQELKKIDPVSAKRIGESDRYRLIRALEIYLLTSKSPSELQGLQPSQPNPQFHLWILDRSNPDLYLRIKNRTDHMLQRGLIQEFQTLFEKFPESRALNSIGYTQVKAFLTGNLPSGRKIKPGYEGLSEEIQLATRQLVKQQRTWFRGQFKTFPQNSNNPHWFYLDEDLNKLKEAFQALYG